MNNRITSTLQIILYLFKGFGANRLICHFIRAVADLPDNYDVLSQWMKVNPEKGNCPVCGEDLTASNQNSKIVVCTECLTPHHHQCFTWNKRCAQYACGSTSVTAYNHLHHWESLIPEIKKEPPVRTVLSDNAESFSQG